MIFNVTVGLNVPECWELAVSTNLDPQIMDHNSSGPVSWRWLI